MAVNQAFPFPVLLQFMCLTHPGLRSVFKVSHWVFAVTGIISKRTLHNYQQPSCSFFYFVYMWQRWDGKRSSHQTLWSAGSKEEVKSSLSKQWITVRISWTGTLGRVTLALKACRHMEKMMWLSLLIIPLHHVEYIAPDNVQTTENCTIIIFNETVSTVPPHTFAFTGCLTCSKPPSVK